MCLVKPAHMADNRAMSRVFQFRMPVVLRAEGTVSRMSPEYTQPHSTQHSGTVKRIEVDDMAVVVDLRALGEDVTVTFQHTADPLLAERAAELEPGHVVSVTAVARRDPDGELVLREGRGLSALRRRAGSGSFACHQQNSQESEHDHEDDDGDDHT